MALERTVGDKARARTAVEALISAAALKASLSLSLHTHIASLHIRFVVHYLSHAHLSLSHILLQQAKGGPQTEPEVGEKPAKGGVDPKATERRAKAVRHKVAAGAIGKAVQSLLGGVADLTTDERASWTRELIPRSSDAARAQIGPQETSDAMAHAWGGGDPGAVREALRRAGKRPGGPPELPWAHLSPLTAPGPSGERREHLDVVLDAAGPRQRRRLVRALDTLAVLWAVNRLPPTCAWLLNTQILFLRKDREPRDKTFDDEAWIASLAQEWEGEGTTTAETDERPASPENPTRPAAPPPNRDLFSRGSSCAKGQQSASWPPITRTSLA